jgi:hypothetical protein
VPVHNLRQRDRSTLLPQLSEELVDLEERLAENWSSKEQCRHNVQEALH